jgi:Ca2+-binding EF-hand superfamily protein
MTTHLATKEERMQLKQSFQQFDVNGDGKIELEEFVVAY